MSDPRSVAHDKKVQQEKKHRLERPSKSGFVQTGARCVFRPEMDTSAWHRPAHLPESQHDQRKRTGTVA
jgi:hypothetical protein